MKKHFITSVASLLLTCSALQAQIQEVWTKEFKTAVKWQKVYASGDYLVATYNTLQKVNTETGEAVWQLPQFSAIEQSSIEEMEGSSLLSISKDNNIFILDPFSGQIKLNAKEAGISKILKTKTLLKSDKLFIAGKDAENKQSLIMVDNSSGNIVWRIDDDLGGIISIQEVSETELLLVTALNNIKINTTNGEIIWKNALSAESERVSNMGGGLGAVVNNLANAAAEQSDLLVKYYEHPTQDIFVIGIENKEDKTNPDGTPGFRYTNSYSAFKNSDGSRLWEKPIEMRGQIGSCTFYKNNFVVLPKDELKSKVNMFDLSTAEKKWGKKGRGTNVNGGVTSHFLSNDKIVVVTKKGNNDFMYVLDVKTGLPMYKKPVKINGNVVYTKETSNGLLFMTSSQVNILNLKTGKLLLNTSMHTSPELTAVDENNFIVFDKMYSLVKSIDLKLGNVKELSNTAVPIDGKESYTKLEVRENGYLLTSEQNVALVGKDGVLAFSKYYPAPKNSGFKQALLYSQAARAAYIGAQAHYVAGAMSSAANKSNDATSSEILNTIGDAYSDLGTQASDFTKASIKSARERFKASAQSKDFVIMVSAEKGNNFLLKVSKETGEILAKIDLGSEKKPNYTIDEVTGQVFLETKKGDIISYKF